MIFPQVNESDKVKDKRLVSALKRREPNAFEQLVLEHQNRVFSLCLRMMKNPEEAEDLAQEVFIKVYNNLHRFKGQSSFSTWLYRITTNMLSSYFRKEKLRRFLPLGEQIFSDDRADERTRSYRDELFSLLNRLSRQERQVVILRGLQELSVAEAAGILGTTENVIKVSYHNARGKLKGWLKDE